MRLKEDLAALSRVAINLILSCLTKKPKKPKKAKDLRVEQGLVEASGLVEGLRFRV